VHPHRDLPAQLIRIGAFAALVAAIAWAASSASKDAAPNSASPPKAYSTDLDRELARCRTVTPEEVAAGESCRRAWAENRRRFLAPSKSVDEPSVPVAPTSTSQPTTSTKDQSRLGEGRASTAPGRRSE
jgi:conjugative transfer region protein TrbK